MFCPSCGTKCPDNAIACHSCGAVLPGLTDTLAGIVDPKGKAGSAVGPTGGATMVANERLVGSSSSNVPRGAANDSQLTPRVGHTKLVVEQGRILGEQFLLNDYELIIGRYDAGTGRCPDIDLTAQDPAYVHRQHVRLAFNRTGDKLMVYDLGGRNGSYLNNQLLEKNASAVVQLGDKIRVGRVVLRVQASREREETRAGG